MISTPSFNKSINVKKEFFVTLLIVLCTLLFICLFFIEKNQTKQVQVVATVNSVPITRSELRHFMLLNKAEVYNHFYRTYNVSSNKDFWTKHFKGKKPLKMLKKHSLDDAVKFKVQQILAKEKGIPVITNFDSLMRERKEINKIRKSKVEKGQVIYGPASLSPRNYVCKVRDEMVRSTKNVLSENDFKIPDEKLKRQYKKYSADRERANIGTEEKEIGSFEAFKAVEQNQYTNKRYAKLIEELSSNSNVNINSRGFNKINL